MMMMMTVMIIEDKPRFSFLYLKNKKKKKKLLKTKKWRKTNIFLRLILVSLIQQTHGLLLQQTKYKKITISLHTIHINYTYIQ